MSRTKFEPIGTITIYGKDQFCALCDAMEVAADMLEAIEVTDDDNSNDPTIEIKSIHRRCFKVTVSSMIEYTPDETVGKEEEES